MYNIPDLAFSKDSDFIINGSFNRIRASIEIAWKIRSLPSIQDIGTWNVDNIHSSLVYLHEITHLFQSYFTPFGSSLNCFYGDQTEMLFDGILTNSSEIEIPHFWSLYDKFKEIGFIESGDILGTFFLMYILNCNWLSEIEFGVASSSLKAIINENCSQLTCLPFRSNIIFQPGPVLSFDFDNAWLCYDSRPIMVLGNLHVLEAGARGLELFYQFGILQKKMSPELYATSLQRMKLPGHLEYHWLILFLVQEGLDEQVSFLVSYLLTIYSLVVSRDKIVSEIPSNIIINNFRDKKGFLFDKTEDGSMRPISIIMHILKDLDQLMYITKKLDPFKISQYFDSISAAYDLPTWHESLSDYLDSIRKLKNTLGTSSDMPSGPFSTYMGILTEKSLATGIDTMIRNPASIVNPLSITEALSPVTFFSTDYRGGSSAKLIGLYFSRLFESMIMRGKPSRDSLPSDNFIYRAIAEGFLQLTGTDNATKNKRTLEQLGLQAMDFFRKLAGSSSEDPYEVMFHFFLKAKKVTGKIISDKGGYVHWRSQPSP